MGILITRDVGKMGGRRLFSLFVLMIIVLAVGVPQVSAFTWKHNVPLNHYFSLREFTMYSLFPRRVLLGRELSSKDKILELGA
jgi:hypothetical protein